VLFRSIDNESDLFTVEHILPESADESWGEFKDEEITRSVYRLGNLTLLEKKLNRDAAVLSYERKKEFFSKSNSELTKGIVENYDSWNEEKLAARQRALAKHAKAIWRIQELGN
jgi:hypothetical protein